MTSYKQVSTELEQKIIALYAYGTSIKDIAEFLLETYGVEISEGFVSQVTSTVLGLAIQKASEHWDKCVPNWPTSFNQFAIHFEGRVVME